MAAARIDLHTHSTASDGTTAPAALMGEAVAAGLTVIALTDHDTTAGHAEAADALPTGLTLVRGAEISCVAAGVSLHLLAYLFDPAEPTFAEARSQLRESRVGRAEQMVRLLERDGIDVSWPQVQALAGGTVGRPHVAQALIAAGKVESVGEAFSSTWIGRDGPYYVGKYELDAVAAVRLVVGAGGVAVFAHPNASRRGRTVGDQVIADMAAAGLTGLEVDHTDHDPAERAHLRGLAGELDLITTGSSDYHGSNKTVRLGAETTTASTYDALLTGATGLAVLTG